MASKTAQDQSPEAIEDMLDVVDTALDRVKTLYEQYFLGIQKQAPAHLHTDVERKLRDLTQMSIRNTGLRYRLATLTQKFGSYNSYWRRTLRQIENGTYARSLSKIGREAKRTGAEIPEEILAAMPKRMRDQVLRDREQAVAIAKRQQTEQVVEPSLEPPSADDFVAMIKEPTELRRGLREVRGAHRISEEDADLDLVGFFASVEAGKPAEPPPKPAPPVRSTTRPPPTPVRAPTGQMPRITATQPAVAPPRPAPPSQPANAPPAAAARPPTGGIPAQAAARPGGIPSILAQTASRPPTGSVPTQAAPSRPPTGSIPTQAPSQVTRPNPIAPGAAATRGDVPVESMSGPFPRVPSVAAPKPVAPPVAAPKPMPPPAAAPKPVPPPAAAKPAHGLSDADVNALYAKFVKAKEMIGETAGPGARDKLLKTINSQAPKIIEQYKAKGVDFTIAVKDNQVIIRAKPKT